MRLLFSFFVLLDVRFRTFDVILQWRQNMCHVIFQGKYCTKFLNQYSFICSKIYKLYKYNINISHNKTTGLPNSFNKHVNKTLVWPHDVESFQGSTFCLFVMVQQWNIGVCYIDQVFVTELTVVIFCCSCSRFEYKNSI